MNYLINYADGAFAESRRKNSISGLNAGFDSVVQYGPQDIDTLFYEKNKEILTQKRGAGYWLWKPYFIFQTLKNLKEGDTVFYSDSGAEFIKLVEPLLDLIQEKEVVGFKLSGNHKEGQYTRKAVIEKLGLNPTETAPINQDAASFIGVKKTQHTGEEDHVIGTWLDLCQDRELIMDKPRDNDEFKEFIDHRHDQSLWSLVSKMRSVYKAPDPSQWGITSGESSEKDFFINHHRNRD
tara:strand:- start:2524 stop:3234 length:711 start_codon:yes stop_codon:yes gene_type:complete